MVEELFYSDQGHNAILILAKDQKPGQMFLINIKYLWFDSPNPDYTVKVYSKYDLQIFDSKSNTNKMHTDG